MNKIARITLITLATLTLVACGQKENSSKKVESNQAESVSVPKEDTAKPSFKNDTLKIEMATLKILSTEVLPADASAYRDKPQLVFTYEVTNNSKDLIQASTVWIACFEATQEAKDTINNLNVGMTPQDEKFNEFKEHEGDDIKTDGTVKAVIAYDLEDLDTPVILKASQGFGGAELGEKKIMLK